MNDGVMSVRDDAEWDGSGKTPASMHKRKNRSCLTDPVESSFVKSAWRAGTPVWRSELPFPRAGSGANRPRLIVHPQEPSHPSDPPPP